jgi:hypothetical protein
MAIRYKVLGQKSPAANTAWDIYAVSGTKDSIINCITVANRDTAPAAYRISVRPDAATLTTDMYLAYDVSIDGNSSVALNLGITLNQNDVVTVQATTSNVSFNVFGAELDV